MTTETLFDPTFGTIRILRSRRKTYSIQCDASCQLVVKAPCSASKREILRVLRQHETRLLSMLQDARIRHQQAQQLGMLTEEDLHHLTKKAASVLSLKTAAYAQQIGVRYGRITIRHQKTRWGSCSSKGNLNYNCLLMLCPEEVQDYVVVHELCHILQMNHSPAFWMEVQKILPDYQTSRRWLKQNGKLIMERLDQSHG